VVDNVSNDVVIDSPVEYADVIPTVVVIVLSDCSAVVILLVVSDVPVVKSIEDVV
jgi:hypothetical protein